MNPILAAILGGLGTGVGAAGAAVVGARKVGDDRARQNRRDDLAELQNAEQMRHNRVVEDAQQTDVGTLFKAIGLPVPEGLTGRMPVATANAAAAAAQKRAEKDTERADLQGIADVTREAAGTPPTNVDVAPDVPVANGMDALMSILKPGKPPMPMDQVRPKLARYGKEGRETFKEMYPQDSYTGVGLDQDLVNKTTGAIVRPGTPKPKEPNQGQRNDARAVAILRDRGITEGSPEWNEGLFILTNPTPTVQDVGIFSRLDALGKSPKPGPGPATGGAPAPRVPVDKTLSPEDAGSLGVPYGTKRSGAVGATPLTAGQRTKMDAQTGVLGMIDQMEKDLVGVTSPSGAVDRITSIPKRALDVYGQADPKLSALHSRIGGTFALVVRALGEVGALTEGDISRAKNLQPVLAPIPDTDEVIAEKFKGLRTLVQEVSNRTGSRPDSVKLGGPAGVGNAQPPARGWKIERVK